MGEEIVPTGEEIVDAEIVGGEVERIRQLDDFTGEAWLIKQAGRYYIASCTMAIFSGLETLIFPANENGEIESWTEVGGGRGMHLDEAIDAFEISGPYEYE